MRKSGLHKQIASIFEGTPKPDGGTDSARSLLQRMSGDTAPVNRIADAPAASVLPHNPQRPRPAQRIEKPDGLWNAAQRFQRTAQKPKAAQPNAAQKRQKMMTAMVAALSVVFVGVLYVAFGGIGQSRAGSMAATASAAAAPGAAVNPETWAFPKPLPSPMRDPMTVPSARGDAAAEDGSHLKVRGIVYSPQRPSAIVNDAVVFVGQVIHGAHIVNITREAVEFEKDGKRWTQGVR